MLMLKHNMQHIYFQPFVRLLFLPQIKIPSDETEGSFLPPSFPEAKKSEFTRAAVHRGYGWS